MRWWPWRSKPVEYVYVGPPVGLMCFVGEHEECAFEGCGCRIGEEYHPRAAHPPRAAYNLQNMLQNDFAMQSEPARQQAEFLVGLAQLRGLSASPSTPPAAPR